MPEYPVEAYRSRRGQANPPFDLKRESTLALSGAGDSAGNHTSKKTL